jgi:5-dehydro-2-deoxygluconokinase
LGLNAPKEHLAASFASAAKHDLVKGFAVGRTIFEDAAKAWFAGKIDDKQAIEMMHGNYSAICGIWAKACERKGEAA